jgi:hypothetical protein
MAPAVAAASGATLINAKVCNFWNFSLARCARDNIATAIAKDSATKAVAPADFDDIPKFPFSRQALYLTGLCGLYV